MVGCTWGAGVVQQEIGITKEDKQTVRGNSNDQGLECGSGITGLHMYQNLSTLYCKYVWLMICK